MVLCGHYHLSDTHTKDSICTLVTSAPLLMPIILSVCTTWTFALRPHDYHNSKHCTICVICPTHFCCTLAIPCITQIHPKIIQEDDIECQILTLHIGKPLEVAPICKSALISRLHKLANIVPCIFNTGCTSWRNKMCIAQLSHVAKAWEGLAGVDSFETWSSEALAKTLKILFPYYISAGPPLGWFAVEVSKVGELFVMFWIDWSKICTHSAFGTIELHEQTNKQIGCIHREHFLEHWPCEARLGAGFIFM